MLSKKKPQDRVDPEYLVGLDTASAQPAPAGVKPFIQKPITAADTYTVKPMVKGTILTADFEVGDTVSKGVCSTPSTAPTWPAAWRRPSSLSTRPRAATTTPWMPSTSAALSVAQSLP